MRNWARSTGQFRSPALVDTEGTKHVSAEEKAPLLRATHLPQDRQAEDIPWTAPPPQERRWPAITMEEVERSILRAGNTAPGQDEVPPDALKLAWPELGEEVHGLYSCCLDSGWHPRTFRTALLCVIENPGSGIGPHHGHIA
jgi:hypothetical protein